MGWNTIVIADVIAEMIWNNLRRYLKEVDPELIINDLQKIPHEADDVQDDGGHY